MSFFVISLLHDKLEFFQEKLKICYYFHKKFRKKNSKFTFLISSIQHFKIYYLSKSKTTIILSMLET